MYERFLTFTKAQARQAARQQGYYIAGQPQTTKWRDWIRVPVWGWDTTRNRITLTNFWLDQEHPEGHCYMPPVSANHFPGDGVIANQLGLPLNWTGDAFTDHPPVAHQ